MTWKMVEGMEKKMQKCAEDPKERMTTPQADGFFMPGEYEPHDGCISICHRVRVHGFTAHAMRGLHSGM